MTKIEVEKLQEILSEILQSLWNGALISKDNGEYLMKLVSELNKEGDKE